MMDSSGGAPPEEVFTNPQALLRAIHPSFLTNVYPFESGLVDELRENSVFDSDDEESIQSEKTRKDRARRCWNLLNQVPPSQFPRCFPALKNRCPLVLGRKEFRWDGKEDCFRHLIQRSMSLRRFADVFPLADGCSQQEYQMLTEGSGLRTSLWDRAFKLCCSNKDNEAFVTVMRTTLSTTRVPVPPNLQSLLTDGLACSCCQAELQRKGQKRKASVISKQKKKPDKRVKKPLEVTDGARDSGKSTASTNGVVVPHTCSSSITAKTLTCAPSVKAGSPSEEALHRSEDAQMASSSQSAREETDDHEDQDWSFESEEQKEAFVRHLEQFNIAITKACSIKVLYQETAGIQLEMKALTQTTRSEPTGKQSLEDKGKTHRLHARIREIQRELEKTYKEVSLAKKTKKIIGDIMKLPDHLRKILLARKEVLAKELNQAEDFYHLSAETLGQFNLDQSKPEESATESQPDVLPSGIKICYDNIDKQIAEQDADSDDGYSCYEWDSEGNDDDACNYSCYEWDSEGNDDDACNSFDPDEEGDVFDLEYEEVDDFDNEDVEDFHNEEVDDFHNEEVDEEDDCSDDNGEPYLIQAGEDDDENIVFYEEDIFDEGDDFADRNDDSDCYNSSYNDSDVIDDNEFEDEDDF
ncbi:hypothetical protein ACOMHN_054673 [Nucella lapillus]